MFMQKVLNWITPLEEAKSQRNNEDDTSSATNRASEIFYEFDQVSNPSYGTATSILEPDRNPADLDYTSEGVELAKKQTHTKGIELKLSDNASFNNYAYSDVELAKKQNHTKDKGLKLSDNASSNNYAYSDVELAKKQNHTKDKGLKLSDNVSSNNYAYSDENHCDLRQAVLTTTDSRHNASSNNVLMVYEDPVAAGGDFAHYADISESASLHEAVSQENIESMINISNPRKSIATQTDLKKRKSTKCNNLLKPVPVASDPHKKTFMNLNTFVSNEALIENDIYSVDPLLYGGFLVLGCNGSAPQQLQRQMKSRFILRKRYHSNGVKEAFSFVTSHTQPLSRPLNAHTVSFKMSGSRSVVVEYVRDKSTDMFQIGRYESSPVDIRVIDVNQARNGVSRFACRIIIQRHGDHQARVYAAAFDSTGNIFLGEGAVVCVKDGKMDGFTTNGVLILHPDSEWREVSVCGNIYPLRSPNVEATKRARIMEESNVLQDGTLIDLCGVTLLWRSKESLTITPSEEYLQNAENLLQELAIECHLLPHSAFNVGKDYTYIFLSCGHLMKLRVLADNMEGWSCPVCRCIGSIAELKVGMEPGFYVDRDFPACAFRPCGHVVTLKTAQYWSSIKLPEHRNIQEAFCPFCATKLNSITKYIEIAYPQ